MKQDPPQANRTLLVKPGRRTVGLVAAVFAGAGFMAVLTWSGVVAFQRDSNAVPLAATDKPIEPATKRSGLVERPAPTVNVVVPVMSYEEVRVSTATSEATARAASIEAGLATPKRDAVLTPTRVAPTPGVKYDRQGKAIIVSGKPWTGEVFDYRPIRVTKTTTMKTTAYSPDAKSCGKWADGITASGKSVWMNGGRLVAADRSVPYGTILTIPGYNEGKPVQVWDRGGAIKGNRLDLLYPTHEIALQWGVQDLSVEFWEYVETD